MADENATESVLDAVNAALGDVIDAPNDAPPADDVELGDETSGSESDDLGADETAGEGGEDSVDGERNPDGTFKKKPETKVEAESDKKLDKDGKPIVEKKPADPLNDPIPKDLKKETQERIRTLISTTKEITAERDTIKRDFEYLVQGVQATGASPQQYGETLSWLALFNSNDPAQQEKALELVESVADRLSTLLGKERSVGNPLANHPDLMAAVQQGQVAPKYAAEIARTRNAQGFRSQLQGQVRQEQTQQQQAAQELAASREALNQLEAQLKATDPQYDAKRAALVPILKPLMANLPPAQRAAAFQQAYQNYQLPATAKPRVPANQPMRAGKTPAGGGTRQAGSMLDAVNGALAGMK
jgi:hypothetical protein